MATRYRTARGIATGLVVLGLAGCADGPKRLPVAGTVTVDGVPVDNAVVKYAPDYQKGNTLRVNCTGRVEGGRYELRSTGVTPSESGAGVAPGWYKVTVVSQGDPAKSKSVAVHDRYQNSSTTPLAIEIVDQEVPPGTYDLKLTK